MREIHSKIETMHNILNKVFLSLLLLTWSIFCTAITEDKEKNDSTVLFKDRIGVRTNAVNWFLMTPNIGVEYDIVNTKYKKVSLSLNGKYNWNSNFKRTKRYAYNIAGLKAEGRWYFRTYKREQWETDWFNSVEGFYDKLQAKRYSIRSRNNPRTYRAYYIGPYLSYDKYTLKLTDTGYQGSAIGFGLTFGYDIPLYKYNNGSAIDFEFGASAGFIYTGYDKFAYDPDSYCYHYTGTKESHFVPFPMLTDVNVAFVYRMKSIREQIKEVDKSRMEMMRAAYGFRESYKKQMTVRKITEIRKIAVTDPALLKKGDSIMYDTVYTTVKRFNDHDSINIFNAEVLRKNTAIKEYNVQLSKLPEIDSTLYLSSLKPMYRFLEISDKMLSFGYKKTIPNMAIDSIRQLESKELNEILKAYSEIGNGDNLESVEKRMLTDYNSTRDQYAGMGDSLKPINLLEYLVLIVPRINEYCITNHNNKYFGGAASEGTDMLKTFFTNFDIREDKNYSQIRFLEIGVIDTIYLVEPMNFGFDGMNQEIEANNEALKLQTLPLITPATETKADVTAEKKGKKGKTKHKKKKNKEEVATADSITEQALPDSLKSNTEQALPDSLKNNTEQTLPDSLKNNETDLAYIYRTRARSIIAAIEPKAARTLPSNN